MSDIRKYMKQRDSKLNEDTDEDVLEEKLKRHRRSKASKWIILVAVLIIAGVGYLIYLDNKVYTTYEVLESAPITDNYNGKFYEFGDYMLRYSEDGIAYLNGSKTYWNHAFEMRAPIIDICNSYVAVAEQKSNTIYICNNKGFQGEVETEYPIVGLDVSDNGIVAAITGENSELSYIEVIDEDGTRIAKGQSVLSSQGCPVDISISEDGTKLVVSYLCVGSGVIQSKVVFYNYSEIGKNEVDRFVGGYNFDKTMVARVEFVNNDTVVAFGDDKVVLYSMKQKPSVIAEISIDKEIKSIFYDEEYIGLVLANGQADNPYNMVVYDIEGKKISDVDFNLSYKNIKIANKTIILYNDVTLRVYTVKGKQKYEGNFDKGIVDVIMLDDKYNYLIIDPANVEKIKLK
ncbi:MAG: DUF5711 family protein [Lachnospiraceae bacterium]|nr:DUF5711 family protein [Lachnospiraceae bacterium]